MSMKPIGVAVFLLCDDRRKDLGSFRSFWVPGIGDEFDFEGKSLRVVGRYWSELDEGDPIVGLECINTRAR